MSDAQVVITSEEEDSDKSQHELLEALNSKNRAQPVMHLHSRAFSKMQEIDRSPFVQLVAEVQTVDVLCVNCYQCVPFDLVDEHSETCQGRRAEPTDNANCTYTVILDNDESNDRILKLQTALRIRLVEIQQNLKNPLTPNKDQLYNLSQFYSKVFALGQKIVQCD